MRSSLIQPGRSKGGFTLVEVLVVVVIIGLAGAVIVPRMLAPGTMGIQAAARMVMADMMFAQNDAIANQAGRRIVFDLTGERYSITDLAGQTIHVPWKGGGTGNYVVFLNDDPRFDGVQLLSADFGGTNQLEFDDLGAPQSGGTVELQFQNLRYRISVASFTGRVTVEQL